jgi:DNA helicase-2/ATP-dependent DNA helicase PcrA
MFYWDIGDLSDEQEQAILYPDSVLLIACPGSGKTRALTYKIALELSKLVSEKQYILAITYTNAAADEIKERIEILGISTTQLWIGTIHSFCLEWILKPYYLYLDNLKHGFKVINSHDSEIIISELCKKYKYPTINYYDCQFFATIKNYRITSLETEKHPSIKKVIIEYFEILSANEQVDFEQILFFSYKLLKGNPIIGEILSKIFPFILIDEFQDTKQIQYYIVSAIINNGSNKINAFIVGDPNQSIYDTLGGYPMKKIEMEELFGMTIKELQLSGNYRSSTKIIQYFENFKVFPNNIKAIGEYKDYPSVITYNSLVDNSLLEDEIVELILFNIEKERISPNEICIAAPQWIHLAGLTRNLMIKLPDFNFDGPGMAPFSRDIDNFWYKLSRIILTEPSPDMYLKRLRWAKEILNELNFVEADISEITPKYLLKICNSLSIDESDGLEYLRISFDHLFSILSLKIDTFSSLKEHYDSFFDSSQARIKRLSEQGFGFIGTIENFKKIFKQRKGIKISTIHGLKGTEYDTVIGFGLLDGWVPHFKDNNGDSNSKKMLYVLCSRARKNLHLISETGRNINWHNPHGRPPTPHLTRLNYTYDE